ncbi:MAG: hypothetical protein ACK5XV_08950 [Flavobacteriales bacterium]
MSILTSGRAQGPGDEYALPAASPVGNEKKPLRERLVFGGGLGAQFGNFTFIQLAPQVGYQTTERWVNGVGVNYMYFNTQGRSTSIYGGSIWSRYFVTSGVFIGSELEVLNREWYTPQKGFHRANVPICMVGAGYFSGGQVGVGIQIMYDVIGDPASPYQNPIIRGGLMLGL